MGNELGREYTLTEEVSHGVTHGVAAIASIVGLVVLAVSTASSGELSHLVAVSIFGGSMILMYTASTLYHSIPNPGAQRILHVLDHAAIYVLIAGTYTPYALIGLQGATGWWLFGIIWSLALLGVVFKLFFTGRFDKLSVGLYLAMGWLVVGFAKPIMQTVDADVIWLAAAGGLAYSLGVVFYLWRSLPHNHTVWHLFVIFGSVLQYLSVFALVAKP
jgi:hemolysin III